ncbi:MAG: type II secretion system F family protein [Oscillospiraceae bacterium]|nr:type II secretion system F family protein [Oscillospiraceae bacterium]
MTTQKKTLPQQYISFFCLSLHLAFKAGITLAESVEMYYQEEKESYYRGIIGKIAAELQLAHSFADALLSTGVFPQYVTDMIEIGERTGRLDDTLLSLARYYERQEEITHGVRVAVAYPIMLLAVLVFVFVIFAVKILPIFNDIYVQLSAAVPPSVSAVLKFGRWLSEYWIPVVIVIVVIAALAFIFRRVISKAVGVIIAKSSLGRTMIAARLSSSISMTLSSGLTINEGLQMSAEIIDDKPIKLKVSDAAAKADTGAPLTECVTDLGVFSAMYIKMIGIGERTGTMVEVMEEIARRSSDDASGKLDAIVSKIEPTLVIFMSVLVGALLISVMLPLAGVMALI